MSSQRKVSPAMMVACLALLVSLAGTGFAGTKAQYIITSTSQIKPSVLNALVGEQGPRGPKGETGAPGATHLVVRTAAGPRDSLRSDAFVSCRSGEVAVGGGVNSNSYDGQPMVSQSTPYPTGGPNPTGWYGDMYNIAKNAEGLMGTVQANVYVVCASP